VSLARVHIVAATLACAMTTTSAWADTAGECIAAAEQAQPLQHDGKLRAASERLHQCARPECPAVVRADCTRWLANLEASMPSIVVHAVDAAGADLTDVRVFVDGELVASSLDGRDIHVDPGPHVLRFEHGTGAPVEQRMVADVGAQHRLISVAFGAGAPATTAPPAARIGTATAPAVAEHAASTYSGPRRSMVLPFTIGAVGLVTAAVGGVVWAEGLSRCRSSIEPSAPSCTSVQLDGAHGTLVAGDVLVATGGALIAAGLVLWLVYRGDPPPPAVTAAAAGIVRF
jgi:hypothetical protein